MPETVDVAVVGGGVIGLSVARELRLAGVDRVVVLEREASVGQGSSSRANGGVRAQFTTRANIEFSAFSIAELERLDAATGLLGRRPGRGRAGHHRDQPDLRPAPAAPLPVRRGDLVVETAVL